MLQQIYKKLILYAVFTIFSLHALCQAINAKSWATLLNKPPDQINTATQVVYDSLESKPAAEIRLVMTALENDKNILNDQAALARLSLLKTRLCRKGWMLLNNNDWKYWGNDALKTATVLEDDYLIQSTCFVLGDAWFSTNNLDTSIFYMLKALELAEKLHYKKEVIANNKIAASNALYRTQNYRQCILFCNNGLNMETSFSPIAIITCYNNLGMSYLRLHQADSAIFFFAKALNFAHKIRWGVWEGILSGNIGDALHAQGKDAEAMKYWQKDYDSCMYYKEFTNAGLTLAYISQYQFNTGAREKAIHQLLWAERTNSTDAANLVRIYKIQATCYGKMGLHDPADRYWQMYYSLYDSLSRVINRNNFNTIQLKLNFESTGNEIKLLKKERTAEIIQRNLLLIALFLLLITGLLLYKWQQLKIKIAQQQKAIAETEINSAKEQLHIFTQILLEKNEQIKELSNSLQQHAIAANDDLIHQTLLTDYDWNRFKELFEKIHPGFFTALKNVAVGITQSEMRLAALIKLNLDNKQMASMQGISVSSLRGNKTRLRQKLNISAETSLEELVKQL